MAYTFLGPDPDAGPMAFSSAPRWALEDSNPDFSHAHHHHVARSADSTKEQSPFTSRNSSTLRQVAV